MEENGTSSPGRDSLGAQGPQFIQAADQYHVLNTILGELPWYHLLQALEYGIHLEKGQTLVDFYQTGKTSWNLQNQKDGEISAIKEKKKEVGHKAFTIKEAMD